MKRSIGLWQLWGFAATSFLGTLLHFLYEWLGEASWIAPLSGVNESTWEHMKLLFWPMLLFAVAESLFFKEREDFWCVKARGTLLGLLLSPVLFYTYNGVLGKSPDWINIAIFFLSAAVAYLHETKQFRAHIPCKRPRIAIALLCAIAVLFIVFTFFPPSLPLFQDPITGGYGRNAASSP